MPEAMTKEERDRDLKWPRLNEWGGSKVAQDAGHMLLLINPGGDYYEAYKQDAEIIAKECELTKQYRNGTTMVGVPFHMLEKVSCRLAKAGYRIAVVVDSTDHWTK